MILQLLRSYICTTYNVCTFIVHTAHRALCNIIFYTYIVHPNVFCVCEPMPFCHVNGGSQSFFLQCREMFYLISFARSLSFVLSFLLSVYLLVPIIFLHSYIHLIFQWYLTMESRTITVVVIILCVSKYLA